MSDTHLIRATYDTTVIGNVIAIRDSGSGKSVTNDAENVVSDLAKAGFNLADYRIIYRDTRGVWDEMVIRAERFAGFSSINEHDLTAALAKVGAAAGSCTGPVDGDGQPCRFRNHYYCEKCKTDWQDD